MTDKQQGATKGELELATIALETIQQDRKMWIRCADLDCVIEAQSLRLREAAALLGMEWNGAFSEAHVRIIATAYKLKEQMADD